MIVENVIVGSCLPAIIKSYQDNIPIIIPRHVKPTIDLKLQSQSRFENLTTDSYSEAWSMLKFLCAIRGLIINPDSLDYVKICGDKVTFKNTDVEFSKCHFFADSIVKNELEIISIENEIKYKIIDFMRLKFCDASNLVSISVKDSFISKIYPISKKELCAVSFLDKDNLTDFNYSDTMVRFTTQKILESDPRLHRPLIHKTGTSRRIPKLEVVERVVVPLKEVVYKSTKKVKFYDRKKRDNIIKTYCRHNPSI